MAKTMKTNQKSVYLRERDIQSKGYFRVELKERFYDPFTSGEYITDFDDSTGIIVRAYKKNDDVNIIDDRSGERIFKYTKVDDEQVLRIIRSYLVDNGSLVDLVSNVVSLDEIAKSGLTKYSGEKYFGEEYRENQEERKKTNLIMKTV